MTAPAPGDGAAAAGHPAPAGLAAGADGTLWVSDPGRRRIARLGSDGEETGAAAATGAFRDPRGLVATADGTAVLVADPGGHAVRRLDRATGRVETVAGTGEPGGALAASAAPAHRVGLAGPAALALDDERRVLFVALAGSRQIARVDLRAGTAGAIAGADGSGPADGSAREARLFRPRGLALAADRRRLYIADDRAGVRVLDLELGRVDTVLAAGAAGAPVRAADVALTPAGVAVADDVGGAVFGVNPRHRVATAIWRGEPGCAACAVVFERGRRGYAVADPASGAVIRIAGDRSWVTAIRLAGGGPPG